jgi:hypothetical protein
VCVYVQFLSKCICVSFVFVFEWACDNFTHDYCIKPGNMYAFAFLRTPGYVNEY